MYQMVPWSKEVWVYQCLNCNECRDTEDEMILHVLKHVEESKRDEVFDQLLKEKK